MSSRKKWSDNEESFVSGIYYGNFWSNVNHKKKKISSTVRKRIAGIANLFLDEIRDPSIVVPQKTAGIMIPGEPMKPLDMSSEGLKSFGQQFLWNDRAAKEKAAKEALETEQFIQYAKRMAKDRKEADERFKVAMEKKAQEEEARLRRSSIPASADNSSWFQAAKDWVSSLFSSVWGGLNDMVSKSVSLAKDNPGYAFLALVSVAAVSAVAYRYATRPEAAVDRLAGNLRRREQSIEAFMKRLANAVPEANRSYDPIINQYFNDSAAKLFYIKNQILEIPGDREPLKAAEVLATLMEIESNLKTIQVKMGFTN